MLVTHDITHDPLGMCLTYRIFASGTGKGWVKHLNRRHRYLANGKYGTHLDNISSGSFQHQSTVHNYVGSYVLLSNHLLHRRI